MKTICSICPERNKCEHRESPDTLELSELNQCEIYHAKVRQDYRHAVDIMPEYLWRG